MPDTKAHAIFLEVALSSHDWRMIERALLVLTHFKVLPFSPVDPSKESDRGRHEYFWQRQLAMLLEKALGSVLKKGGDIVPSERWRELEHWRHTVSTYLEERGRRDEEGRNTEEAAKKDTRKEARKWDEVVENEAARWKEAGLGSTLIAERVDEEGNDGYDSEAPITEGRGSNSSVDSRRAPRFDRAPPFEDDDGGADDAFTGRNSARRFDRLGSGEMHRNIDRRLAGGRSGNRFDDMAVEDEFDERGLTGSSRSAGDSSYHSLRPWTGGSESRPRGSTGGYSGQPPKYREGVRGGTIRAGLPRDGENRRKFPSHEYIRPVY
jgi:hypothetical protein